MHYARVCSGDGDRWAAIVRQSEKLLVLVDERGHRQSYHCRFSDQPASPRLAADPHNDPSAAFTQRIGCRHMGEVER